MQVYSAANIIIYLFSVNAFTIIFLIAQVEKCDKVVELNVTNMFDYSVNIV